MKLVAMTYRKVRRALWGLTALLLLLSGCGSAEGSAVSSGREAEDATPAPTVYTAHEAEARALRDLGLLKGAPWEFGLEKEITRMEAVILALRLGGREQEALAYTGDCPFTDAPSWTGADRYLAYAASLGLVGGEGGAFRPGEAVTAGEFLEMAFFEMGYIADEPAAMAEELGLLPAGSGITAGGPISKNDCVLFLYNALSETPPGAGGTLLERLVSQGAVSEGCAERLGFLPAGQYDYVLYEQVPVLMYHVIADYSGPNENLYLSPADFQAHLDYFEGAGIHPVTLTDLYLNWYEGKALPPKPVVLSFDDGYISMYTEAFPRLLEKGYGGVFFLYTDFIDVYAALTTDMIRDMAASGMEFGSHSASHPDLTIISADQLHAEVFDSRSILGDITGQSVSFFCYPAGRNNETIRQAVRDAGYLGAVTTDYAAAEYGDDLYGLPRLRINKGCGAETIRSILASVGY